MWLTMTSATRKRLGNELVRATILALIVLGTSLTSLLGVYCALRWQDQVSVDDIWYTRWSFRCSSALREATHCVGPASGPALPCEIVFDRTCESIFPCPR